jgi:hypothetical protein
MGQVFQQDRMYQKEGTICPPSCVRAGRAKEPFQPLLMGLRLLKVQ